jgi:hypothetical protein
VIRKRASFSRSQFQHAARADESHVKSLDGVLQVVLGTGRRRHVDDAIHGSLHRERQGDILLHESEAGVAFQVGEVTWASCQKIVESHNGVAVGQEAVAHVRPDKTGGSGDDNAFLGKIVISFVSIWFHKYRIVFREGARAYELLTVYFWYGLVRGPGPPRRL